MEGALVYRGVPNAWGSLLLASGAWWLRLTLARVPRPSLTLKAGEEVLQLAPVAGS